MLIITFAGVLAQTTEATLPVLWGIWAKALAAYNVPGGPLYGNCSDGVPIVTKLEAYGTQFNCPLVNPAS